MVTNTATPDGPFILVSAVCTHDHPYLVGGGASQPSTADTLLVESAPIHGTLVADAAAGDQLFGVSGDARDFAEGMPVSIDTGANAETGVVGIGPGNVQSTGSNGPVTTDSIELDSPLSNPHAAGTVVTGQGWEAEASSGGSAVTVWALCAK
jgi:hypothetical protein